MSSLLTTLGLRAVGEQQPANHAASFLVANWFYAYFLLSSRGPKMLAGIDHNANPREDLAKYGDAAVAAGKLTRRKLEQLKRNEAAHANSVEGFPFFVAGVLLAVYTGVESSTVNGICLWYTLSRVAFGTAYICIESEALSWLRSIFWWSGNAACITALVLSGKKL